MGIVQAQGQSLAEVEVEPTRAAVLAFLTVAAATTIWNAWALLVVDQYQWHLFEWLISYDAGFVRRGLSGEAVYAASGLVGVSPALVVWVIQAAGHLVFFGAAYVMVRRLDPVPWQLWPMLFSPWLFAVAMYNPGAGLRKDIMVLALLAVVGATAGRSAWPVVIATWLMVPVVLAHEMSAVFLPYLAVPAALASWSRRQIAAASVGVVAVGVAAVAALVAQGDPGDAAVMCERIAAALRETPSVASCGTDGAVSMIGRGSDYGRSIVAPLAGQMARWLPLLLVLVLAGLWPALWLVRRTVTRRRMLVLAVSAGTSTVLTLPLFAVANDWGRFVYLHGIAVALACLALLTHRPYQVARRPLARHGRWLMVGATVLYAAAWHVNHHHQLVGGGLLG